LFFTSVQLAGGRDASSLLAVEATASLESGPSSLMFAMIAFGQAMITPSIP
jgi:hypothetical protein